MLHSVPWPSSASPLVSVITGTPYVRRVYCSTNSSDAHYMLLSILGKVTEKMPVKPWQMHMRAQMKAIVLLYIECAPFPVMLSRAPIKVGWNGMLPSSTSESGDERKPRAADSRAGSSHAGRCVLGRGNLGRTYGAMQKAAKAPTGWFCKRSVYKSPGACLPHSQYLCRPPTVGNYRLEQDVTSATPQEHSAPPEALV
jgi:hypothetical protein